MFLKTVLSPFLPVLRGEESAGLDLELSSFPKDGKSLQKLSRPFWERFHSYTLFPSLPSFFFFCTYLLSRHPASLCLELPYSCSSGAYRLLIVAAASLTSCVALAKSSLSSFSVAATVLGSEKGLREAWKISKGKKKQGEKKSSMRKLKQHDMTVMGVELF